MAPPKPVRYRRQARRCAASTMSPPPRNVGINTAPQTERQIYFQQLKVRIHQQLVERLDVQNLRTFRPKPCAAKCAFSSASCARTKKA